MKQVMLKVRSSAKAMVTNFEALAAKSRRYVGRYFDASLGAINPETQKPQGGWPLKDEPEEIPFRAEYLQAVREGDLIPADKATADVCGVPFVQTSSSQKQK